MESDETTGGHWLDGVLLGLIGLVGLGVVCLLGPHNTELLILAIFFTPLVALVGCLWLLCVTVYRRIRRYIRRPASRPSWSKTQWPE